MGQFGWLVTAKLAFLSGYGKLCLLASPGEDID